jgi:outer membrane protein assembly factor BamB
VYVALYPQSLAALDVSTGSTRWNIPLEPIASLALVNNVLYAGTTSGVYALNALDGSVRWHANQGGTIVGLEVQNNIIYIVSQGGSIQALNASDGEVRWGESTGFELDSLTLDGDRLFASSKVGSLAAWDINGDSLWLEQASEYSYSRVVASNGMLFLAENASDVNPGPAQLLAFSRDGQPLWDAQPSGEFTLAAPVVGSNGLIYTADSENIYAYDALKGAAHWQVQASNGAHVILETVAVNGSAAILCTIASLADGLLRAHILAYSLGEGKPYWQVTRESSTASSSDISCQMLGKLLVVEAFGGLFARDSATGDPLWENPLGDSASPIMALG